MHISQQKASYQIRTLLDNFRIGCFNQLHLFELFIFLCIVHKAMEYIFSTRPLISGMRHCMKRTLIIVIGLAALTSFRVLKKIEREIL